MKATSKKTGSHVLPERASLWTRLLIAYLLLIQPLALVVAPLIRYDEFLLPARDSQLMLVASINSWCGLIISAFGIRVGIRLWRRSESALAPVSSYFISSFAVAAVLALLPYAWSSETFLRTVIRLQQARLFAAGLVAFAVCYGLSLLAATPREALALSSRRRLAMAGALCAAGLTVSVVSFRTAPASIFEAAWQGDVASLRRFIAQGVDVNVAAPDRNISLHLARNGAIADILVNTPSALAETYLLRSDDIKDISRLASKLALRADPVSRLLWERMSPDGRGALTNAATTTREVEAALLFELNMILNDGIPFKRADFAQVQLSPWTAALAAQPPSGIFSLRFNRALLEEAFPNEIARQQIDWRNAMKETPLHLAAWNGHPDVTALLLARQCDLNASNNAGLTPLDFALRARSIHRHGDHDKVIQLLLKKGGVAHQMSDKMIGRDLVSQ